MEPVKIIDHVLWEEKQNFLLDVDTDSFWVMYLITKGSCEFEINGRRGTTSGTAVILCPPNVPFSRRVITPLDFHFFRLDISPAARFINKQFGPISIDEDRLLMNESVIKRYVYDLSSFSFLIRSHLLLDLFLYQVDSKNKNAQTLPKNFSIRNKSIIAVIDYFEAHSEEIFSMEDVAERYNYNSAYFSHLFKNETGISPKKYLLNIRMKKVQQLLISSNLSIEEIADLTGFNHGDYLSKFFKKIFKMTPNEFRKKHRI